MENNLPLDQLDKLAKREVDLHYYWWGDDNVALECFVLAAVSFVFFYAATLGWPKAFARVAE